MKTLTAIVVVALVVLGAYFLINRNGTNEQPITPMTERMAQIGDTVDVDYTGKLADGTVFDSSIPRGKPFSFTLGQGQVIAGWEQGILGMTVGEKKTLVIPPELAYGAGGVPGAIPPNATLTFDVELVAIH